MKADDFLFDTTAASLEELPVGVITLDRAGVILYYNRAESALSGLTADDVVGRRFFGDVAPCTAVREFEGRFLAFAAERTTATEQFDFPFRFSWGVLDVKISMLRRLGRSEIQVVIRTLSQPEVAGDYGPPDTTVALADDGREFAVPYCTTGPVDAAVFWSDELRALFGAAPSYVPVANSLLGRIHPAERDRVRQAFARSAGRRQPFAIQSRTLGFDGKIRTVLLAGGTYGIGDATFSAGTLLDVSGRRYQPRDHRFDLESTVRTALRDDGVGIELQPIVDGATSRVIGCEALARIRTANGTPLVPEDFIAECERSGLILPLGERIFQQVAAEMKSWNGTPLEALRVSVNVSPKQLADVRFVPFVRDLLAGSNIAPERIELELAGRLPERFDDTLDTLVALKLLGTRIAIDHFGTGYSALGYLKYLPVDTLKLDRPLVAGIGQHPLDEAIISTIVRLARELELDVVAEGIETPAQRSHLMAAGVSLMQGFLFERPLAVETFRARRE